MRPEQRVSRLAEAENRGKTPIVRDRARVTEWVHLNLGHFYVQLIGLVPFVIRGLSECQHARVSVQMEQALMVFLSRPLVLTELCQDHGTDKQGSLP